MFTLSPMGTLVENVLAPTALEMKGAYLKTYFSGKSCIVFCDPLNYAGVIAERFKLNREAFTEVLNSELFVVLLDEGYDSAGAFCDTFPEETYGYVIAWDGREIVSENT